MWKTLLTCLLLSGLVSTPVTYRGGAADPHPHMFLQLWIDASSGSFTHEGHGSAESDGKTHSVHRMVDVAPEPLQLDELEGPTVSSFVVSDWGFQTLAPPEPTSL